MGNAQVKTALVFAGGGSLGAVQVGMLKALMSRPLQIDVVVGASVGAINAAYFAGAPTVSGVARLEALWRALTRRAVFPAPPIRTWPSILRGRNFLVDSQPLRELLSRELPFRNLQDAKIPCIVVATNLLEGVEVRITSGSAVDALLASAAIPGVFPPVRFGEQLLIDGGMANQSPIAAAAAQGVQRMIVLPTGYSCTRTVPPRSALSVAMQGINILTVGKLVSAIQQYRNNIQIDVVPPLCPLEVSAIDFSHTGELIARAEKTTLHWLDHGEEMVDGLPHQFPLHSHAEVADAYAAQVI
jgi:NTE family protein